MDPYMWRISSDQEAIRIPSFELLTTVDPCAEMSIEVILIDRFRDSGLKELHNKVLSQSSTCNTTKDTKDMVDHLAKVLADSINLPCRIVKGCKYCRRDVASACLLQIDNEGEYLVDLFVKPEALSQPDSSFKCPSSILVSSPPSHPKFRPTSTEVNFTILAKLNFSNCKSLDPVFEDANTVCAVDQHKEIISDLGEDMNFVASNKNGEDSVLPLVNGADMNIIHGMDMQVLKPSIPRLDIINSKHLVKGQVMPSPILSTRHGHAPPVSIFANPKPDGTDIMWPMGTNKSVIGNTSSELHLEDRFGHSVE